MLSTCKKIELLLSVTFNNNISIYNTKSLNKSLNTYNERNITREKHNTREICHAGGVTVGWLKCSPWGALSAIADAVTATIAMLVDCAPAELIGIARLVLEDTAKSTRQVKATVVRRLFRGALTARTNCTH